MRILDRFARRLGYVPIDTVIQGSAEWARDEQPFVDLTFPGGQRLQGWVDSRLGLVNPATKWWGNPMRNPGELPTRRFNETMAITMDLYRHGHANVTMTVEQLAEVEAEAAALRRATSGPGWRDLGTLPLAFIAPQ